jgi:hypothetical protein
VSATDSIWTRSSNSILAAAAEGKGRVNRIDRALFEGTVPGVKKGSNQLTIVIFEPGGTHNVQRVTASLP